MATRIFHSIRDENLDVQFGAANVNKVKKKAGLGGLKPLSDITNALNKNVSMKGRDSVAPHLQKFQDKGACGRRALADISNSKKLSHNKVSDTSGRKALTDISNSKNLSQHLVIEKSGTKRLDDIGEEGFLHNHQGCIDTMTRGLDLQSFFSTFGFGDDFSEGMGTPSSVLKCEPKADFASSPSHIEYEVIPDLLNEARHQPSSETAENIYFPWSGNCSSPKFELLASL